MYALEGHNVPAIGNAHRKKFEVRSIKCEVGSESRILRESGIVKREWKSTQGNWGSIVFTTFEI